MSSLTPLVKSSASKHAKEKEEIGQNIQVFVRCRPINKAEKDKKTTDQCLVTQLLALIQPLYKLNYKYQ